MAPALTSNSFRLTSGPPRRSSTTITASAAAPKPNPFGIFSTPPKKKKRQGGEEGDANSNSNPNPSKNPFSVDFKSLVPVVGSPSTSALFAGGVGRRRKDAQTVFVAGATGQAGARIARSLLRGGFTVRAGVSDLAAAQELARIAAAYKIISPEEAKRLNAVESAFGDPEAIAKAIGPAAKVVVTVGPAEKSPSAAAAAASAVTTDDALQVVRAAELAGVGHVAVVYDAGTGGVAAGGASTYNVLDGITSFFANLFAQSQPLTLGEFLSKVAETDVSYTLIKASLTDDYAAEGSYGLVVSQEGSTPAGTTARYKVSRSQIATLVADVFSNTAVAENKVVQVSTSPSAASKPIDELFGAVPEDGRRRAYQEALAKAKAEEEEALSASQKAREAAEAAKKLEKEVKKLSEQEAQSASLAQEARERAEAAGTSLENLMDRAKGFGKDFSWEKFSSQLKSSAAQKPEEEKPKAQIATVRGQAKAEKLPPQKAVIRQPTQKQRQTPLQPDPKPEVKKVFGGLFKQEVIYVDDD
ncbi:protein plastid transcriptionally active 16, chloroplastic-like [Ananas comosus]|uniref:Protein plastid transcriptionally active 16, chloroplastic-like n=1 Tax=Ananas comosus TaxID=4615 RepID=A0A6P5G771_ANACO|nr:protein plastid transcriptionally active 16, chloroplastic-like [Ananas comosus]XP_020103657.1 protein plastid transcriptionally active 16, chloroplastic-like [Ananas comosus]